MMKLVCIKGNKKLLKGQSYDCDYIDTTLYTWGGNFTRRINRVNIVGFGQYSVSGFRFEDGTKIPNDYKYDKRPGNNGYDPDYKKDINVGDWVICKTNSIKTLIQGQRYQVEDVIKATGSIAWNNKHKIKLKGSKRFIDFGWNFSLVPKDESRDIALGALFGDSVINGEVGKIDDKENLLIKMIARSILDPNRHKLSIVEWAVEKYGKCGISEDDFKSLLNKKLKTILETF